MKLNFSSVNLSHHGLINRPVKWTWKSRENNCPFLCWSYPRSYKNIASEKSQKGKLFTTEWGDLSPLSHRALHTSTLTIPDELAFVVLFILFPIMDELPKLVSWCFLWIQNMLHCSRHKIIFSALYWWSEYTPLLLACKDYIYSYTRYFLHIPTSPFNSQCLCCHTGKSQ